MAAKEQIMEMLSQGLQPTQVAATLGLSDGYVSQLLSDEDFAAELELKKVAVAQEDIEFDNKIDSVEATFLDRIEQKAPLANLQQSLQAFAVLNKAKRRKDSFVQRSQIPAGAVVNIQINVDKLPSYIMNGNAEIVEVEGKTMVSATPTKLDEILAVRLGKQPGQKSLQLPGITKVERAAGVLEVLDNRPARKLPKLITSDMNVADIL